MAQTDDDLRADDDGMAQPVRVGSEDARSRKEAYDLGVRDGYDQAMDDFEATIKRQRFMHRVGLQVNL